VWASRANKQFDGDGDDNRSADTGNFGTETEPANTKPATQPPQTSPITGVVESEPEHLILNRPKISVKLLPPSLALGPREEGPGRVRNRPNWAWKD